MTTAKKSSKFEDKLISAAGKISRNTVLQVIQHSFMLIFPFMMIGSIFALITGLPSEAWTNWLASTGLDVILQIPAQYTTEFISVYLVYAIAYYYCVQKGNKKNAIVTGLIAIFAFFLILPYQTVGEGWEAITSIPFTYTGSRGMFIAIFTGFGVGAFCTMAFKKKWTIKLPDSVPPFVVSSFASLIPSFLITFIFLAIRFLFSLTSYGDIFTWFYTVLKAPLSVITSGPWGVAVLEFISMLLWWLGIHGGAVTYQIKNILWADNRLGNLAAYGAGQPLQNIVTGLFLNMGVWPLVFLLLVACRSKRAKSVGKIALVPSIFGIAEPVNFGLPVVLNPVLFIPQVLINPISVLFTYIINRAGLMPYCNGVQIRNCPYPILAFLQFGGIKGLLWWVVLFVISCLIYLPFVRALDKQYCKDEGVSEAETEPAKSVDVSESDDTVVVTCTKPEKVVEAFDGKTVAGIAFRSKGVVEHSVTLSFDKRSTSKEDVIKALKKYFKEDEYFSGLMVQVK